jgi:hypothetical protein
MPNNETIETAAVASEHEDGRDQRRPSLSRLAAVVEAAYILEAVRK